MAVSDGYVELVKEMLADFAPTSVRRMFSGAGLFADGVMFALIVDDTLYFRSDDDSRAAFEAEGLTPFSYNRGGRTVALGYWRAPERLLDDADEMLAWASRALSAAKRLAARSRPGTGRKRRKSS